MRFFYSLYHRFSLWLMYHYHARWKPKGGRFNDILVKEGRTRWLDMGVSANYNDNFFFADLYPKEEAIPEIKDRYFQVDMTKEISEDLLKDMGTFDLIRMQHVYEHFSPEDAQVALKNCKKLLNQGGYLLMSVPDLKIFVKRYMHGCVDDQHEQWRFRDWAETRVEKGAPQSYYFSIFSHSVPYQRHEWCYDYEGLKYGIEKSGGFTDIKRVGVYDSIADIPFTHNRPWEDVTVLARKK